MYGLGVGRETRHKMCLFFVKELVSVRGLFPSPAWPLGCPRDKGMHPRGLPEEGRKEKERSSPSACHRWSCYLPRQGGLSPPLPALCFFLEYRILGEFNPWKVEAATSPNPCYTGPWVLSPVPAHVTVCTSQTGFGEKEENRECCHFLAMEKKLEN